MGLGALLLKQPTWPWAKVPKVVTYNLFLSQDVKIEHIFALWAAVSEIMADFQNCHIWVWNLHAWPLAKIPEVAHILFFPQGLKIELILTLWTADSEILAKFQNCHISAWIPEIELTFVLRAAVSEIQTNFWNWHIWSWNLASGQSSRSCTYTLFLTQEGQKWAYFIFMRETRGSE